MHDRMTQSLPNDSDRALRVSIHTSFDDLPQSARDLCEAAAGSRWFDSLAWFQCLYATALKDSVQLRLYVASSESDEAIACLFCCTRGPRNRVLASVSNYYTMEFGPIVRPGADLQAACAALATFIGAERPRWHTVQLEYLKESNAATAALVSALDRADFTVHRYHQYENWYLDCAGIRSEEYFDGRPSRLRNTIERKGRKLGKSHKVDFVLYRYPTDDIDRGVRDYIAVYNSSWKRPEPHPAFMPELAKRLVTQDSLRLGILYVDDKPAAAQFWITTRSEACIYKLAYDELYAAASVGALLSREMFRHALDVDGTTRIDYGVGSEAYKREWMSAVQEIFGVCAHSRKSARGIWRNIRAMTQTAIRNFLRRSAH